MCAKSQAELRYDFPEIVKGEVFFFADSQYELPKADWLLGPFWLWLRKGVMLPLGLTDYEDSKWDCDDFSRFYAASAGICHKRSAKRNSAIAVGEFWFRREDGVKHAICVAITDKGRIFIEPQTGEEVILSKQEIQSSWLVRF